MSKGLLEEWDINQVKLAYAYSKQKLTVQTEASYYAMLTGMICLMHSVVKQK